ETGEPIVDIEVNGTTSANPTVERSWLVGYYPIKSPDGKVVLLSTIVTDITGQKSAQKSLTDSEARFRMLYENAPVMIDAFDSDGRCIMFNKECERVLGLSSEDKFENRQLLS
ncbi:MAG: PAS domain S-box protein, partial [Candidatus Poribacteria bacterium]|nr:PAS domain S-box protein [Candidatus Poribacteria bacterium]